MCFGRQAGDFARAGSPEAREAQVRLTGVAWTSFRQVHGARAVIVDALGDHQGEEADAAVAAGARGLALAVMTADCAPVGLASPEGVAAVVHAGWRGLMAGVVEAAAGTMRSLGATELSAVVGPCIYPHAYSFSPADLDAVAGRLGPTVRSFDDEGRPALDLPAAVRAALDRAGAGLVDEAGTCTHCSAEHWSWRARQDRGRQANVLLSGPLLAPEGPTVATRGWAGSGPSGGTAMVGLSGPVEESGRAGPGRRAQESGNGH